MTTPKIVTTITNREADRFGNQTLTVRVDGVARPGLVPGYPGHEVVVVCVREDGSASCLTTTFGRYGYRCDSAKVRAAAIRAARRAVSSAPTTRPTRPREGAPQEDPVNTHTLHRYLTGEALRPATFDERRSYLAAMLNSGVGLGVVLVDDLPCYVEDGSGYADPACEEQAWEAYYDACASWGETAAEVGASHFVSTRNAVDASLVGARAAGPLPRLEDYGLTRYTPPPGPPAHDDDEIPF